MKVTKLSLSIYSTRRFVVALGQVTQYILRWEHFKYFSHPPPKKILKRIGIIMNRKPKRILLLLKSHVEYR